MTRLYIQKYKGSGNEIKNSKILNINEYKRHQLIDHQLFTADVNIKSWLKVTRPSYFVRVLSYFEALWYPHLYVDRKSNI